MVAACPSEESLALMLDDRLEGPEAEAVEAHVAACRACQAALERMTAGPPVEDADTYRSWSPGTEEIAAKAPARGPAAGPDGSDPSAETMDLPPSGAPAAPTARGDESFPEIPGYRIERELGRGGMGIVYLARQAHAQRMVALKMVLAERARPEDLLRFLMEGESLARLRHPNIVQIHEVGECLGRPFFSMEYVAGGNLADRLASAPPTPGEAASLLETIARAVHAAHQAGVIHRDLKPANILLDDKADAPGESRGSGPRAAAPKVTDFGLAKHVGTNDGLTQTGQVLGTPSYMAPEQASGGAAVGVQADVYALGAILYEALAGRPPFKGASAWETMMQVVHDPVAPPSRRRAGLPRDLEVICLKCLEKDPAARYPSADAVAEDLRRFRAGEPILARPTSPARMAWLWCRRNPLPSAMAAALLASALAGSAGVGWSWREATRERAEKAMVADYLTNRVLAEASTEVNPKGANFTVRELLDRVGSRIAGDFQGHPEIEAAIRETVGKSYLWLGEDALAETHLRASLRLAGETRGSDDPSTLRVATLLAVALEQSGRPGPAEALLRETLATARRSLGADDPITLEAAARLGALLRAAGKLDEAAPLIRSALGARRRVLPPDHPDTLRSVRDLCLLEVDLRHLDEASALADEYERGIRCARGPKHPDNVTALANLGLIQALRGRLDRAEPFYRRAAEEARRILGEDHTITRHAVAEHARVAASAASPAPPQPSPSEKSPCPPIAERSR
jgi:serine/threonine protein kinase